MLNIKRLKSGERDFESTLKSLVAWGEQLDVEVQETVRSILQDVKSQGDSALVRYTQRFDRLDIESASDLEVTQERLQAALAGLSDAQRNALLVSADRVRAYHQHQVQESFDYTESDGTRLGQRVSPLSRAGIYVPGGKASYPSSVLMNAIPAKVAGVNEVIMVVPTPDSEVNELVFAAAAIAGVDRVFTVGGAQAVAALAYGTETIPAVDKIVGPGNIYVATAKREVFGTVGIDMIAGPSEILVICDGLTHPDWIAMDLFSQAEHDENAQPILLSPDKRYLDQVHQSIETLLPTMERADIIRACLNSRAIMIEVESLEDAAQISNMIAPEHLELSVEDPDTLLRHITNAGAIFMGRYTAEALGDYCAGPNHVLPTSGTARFSSPLSVYDFQKRTSILHFSEQGASELGKIASIMARGEGLIAHARSAEYRIKGQG